MKVRDGGSWALLSFLASCFLTPACRSDLSSGAGHCGSEDDIYPAAHPSGNGPEGLEQAARGPKRSENGGGAKKECARGKYSSRGAYNESAMVQFHFIEMRKTTTNTYKAHTIPDVYLCLLQPH